MDGGREGGKGREREGGREKEGRVRVKASRKMREGGRQTGTMSANLEIHSEYGVFIACHME